MNMWMSCRRPVSWLFVLALPVVPPDAWPETIPEVTDRLMSGALIERDYIRPLGIEGRSAAIALDTLLAEGFGCAIVPAGEYAPGADPMWHCYKQPSGYASPCDELSVPVRFAPPVPWTTRESLLLHVDDIRVSSVRVFCTPSREVPATYLAARGVAEKELESYVRSLDLPRDGQSAYKAMLLAGFYCGISRPANARASKAEMVCIKNPSQIKFCADAKVVLGVVWPAEAEASDQLYGALRLARVEVARSSCEIPGIGGSRANQPS